MAWTSNTTTDAPLNVRVFVANSADNTVRIAKRVANDDPYGDPEWQLEDGTRAPLDQYDYWDYLHATPIPSLLSYAPWVILAEIAPRDGISLVVANDMTDEQIVTMRVHQTADMYGTTMMTSDLIDSEGAIWVGVEWRYCREIPRYPT